MLLLILGFSILLIFSSCQNVSKNDCDIFSDFGNKIDKSDLIMVGRILNIVNNDIVVSVIKILKGFELINEVKQISHNNDYHLILVRYKKHLNLCKIKIKTGDDFLFYLMKTAQHNFFDLKYITEFGDGSLEKKVSTFINGGSSKQILNNDPCTKLDCKFGAQCQKWPGNPPTAVCHCSTTKCAGSASENRLCGSDGNFYESECHMQRQECIRQKTIKPSPINVCDTSVINKAKSNEQQDEVSPNNGLFCEHQSCPSYARCISHPYPHCKCPTDKCDAESPVICGTDEITYTNICEMKMVSCKANRYIGKQYEGRCDLCKFVKCEFNGACEMTEDGLGTRCKCPESEKTCSKAAEVPVCGSDDRTYQSECHMKIESCQQKVILSVVHKGTCKIKVQKDLCTNQQCFFGAKCVTNSQKLRNIAHCSCDHIECNPTDKNLICGDDGETYTNRCFMDKVICEKQKRINILNQGQCDPCAEVSCPTNQICSLDENRQPKCKCQFNCDKIAQQPVCGSTGKNYQSVCHMRLDSCQSGYPIDILSTGACPFEQNPCLGVKCEGPYEYCRVDVNGKGRCVCPDSCPQVVQPVCGNDNKTYDSICHLTRASCSWQKKLWIIHSGICSEEPRCQEQGYDCSPNQICRSDIKQTVCECPKCPDSGIGEYVCGSDGKTYRSECHLRNAACTTNSVSLKVANTGPCDACQNKKCLFYSICRMNRFGEPQCICPTDCVYIRNPVCGSDGRTYENDCFLKVKSCAENRPISVLSEGPCRPPKKEDSGKKCSKACPMGQMCRFGSCVCTDKCPKLVLKVCGSDGSYYDNECELKRQACLQRKTIRTDILESSCISRQYISDETNINKNNKICYCNKLGSVNMDCDYSTGQCSCKTGVTGHNCDKCSDGYWNLTESGCLACSCNKFGSQSIQCDTDNGKCQCKGLALGKYCSVCPPGYLMSNNGCKGSSVSENKIDAAELGFVKDSFAKSYWSGNAEKYLSINISFVPYSTDGIIFYHSDPDLSQDFLSLILKDRFIEYRLDLGSGILLLKSNIQLSLGRSHSILVERFNRHTRLVVDDIDSVYGTSPPFLNSLDAGASFMIGQATGLKADSLSHTNNVVEGFTGCLSFLKIVAGDEKNSYLMNQLTLWIIESSNVKPDCPHIDMRLVSQVSEDDNQHENLSKENSGSKDYCEIHKPCQNGGTCRPVSEGNYNCQCVPGYQGYTCEEMVSPIWKFKDSSFVIFPTESLQLRQRLKLEISFLPTSTSGLISFISDGHDRNPAFISVILDKSHVEVTCRTPIGVTKLVSSEPVLISKWNHVVVLKAAKYVYLNLNQSPQPIKKRLIPKGFMNVDSYVRRKLTQFRITNQPLFFGGVDNIIYNSFSNVVSLRPNFQGAMQKIIVNGENMNFQNSDILLRNITQWQGPPCGPLHNKCLITDPERSYCIAEMNKSLCFCNPKQEHLCMRNSMQQDNPITTNFNRKFQGESAAKYTASKQKRDKSTTKNNIRIKFKTDASDGLLLLMKKLYSTKKHFLVIAIRNSVIEVAINLGGKNGTIRIDSRKPISDNKWHTVQVIRNNRNVVLLVDNRMFRAKMLNDFKHNVLETDGWMWLGGLKKSIEGFPWEYNKNFKGCVAELYVEEVAYNLINDARKNIGPVLKC